MCVAYLILMMRNSSEIFYARGGRLSFHTAKTQAVPKRFSSPKNCTQPVAVHVDTTV